MLFSILVAGGIIIAAMNVVATVIGMGLWLVCVYGLRKMAKADPVMSKVYMRQLRFRDYYAPFSRPWRVSRTRRIY